MGTTTLQGAASSPAATRPVFVPDSKIRPPRSRDGDVHRARLLAELSADEYELAVVLAPAGYGKTTVIRQWADTGPEPLAWASLGSIDNDPVVLMSTVLAALEGAGLRPGPTAGVLGGDEPAFSRRVLPEYRRAIERIGRPVCLVLDDVHTVRGRRATEVLAATVESLPVGSRLGIVGRARPDLPLARWKGQRRVVELGAEDLAFDEEETRACVAQVLVRPPTEQELDTVSATSEGWPVAVYLEATAVRRRGATSRTASFAVRDYLGSEVLGGLEPDLAEFLRRTSVLGSLNADLCDAVLETDDSAGRLRGAASATLLVSRLRGPGGWYRTHPMLREHLADHLSTEDPEQARALHARAARWHAEHDQSEEAIMHAIASADPELLADVAWDYGSTALLLGRNSTVQGWLDQVGQAAVETTAGLAVLAAWTAVDQGDGSAVRRWAEAADRAFGPGWIEHLDRSATRPALALLVCLGGELPHDEAAGLAGAAAAAMPAAHWTRALAVLIEGWCLVLAGSAERGVDRLRQAQALSESMGTGTTSVEAPALLGLVLASGGERRGAVQALAAATRAWVAHDLQDAAPATSLLVGLDTFLHVRQRPVDQTRAELAGIATHTEELARVMPAVAVLVESFVARTSAVIGELPDAIAALERAELAAPHTVESAWLAGVLQVARDDVERASPVAGLTEGQRRIWYELATDKTINEIAGDLFVSPNTVKAHLREIYRKLGVSSRREAARLAPQVTDGGRARSGRG